MIEREYGAHTHIQTRCLQFPAKMGELVFNRGGGKSAELLVSGDVSVFR